MIISIIKSPNYNIIKLNLLALIGHPLSHSFSKQYFEEKFSQQGLTDWSYELWPMEDLSQLEQRIKESPNLKGFNITIPHKINIISFLDDLSDEAESIGAVNCVKVSLQDGAPFLTGHNTDAYGFEKSLLTWYQPALNKAIVFGNGGAAKAVKYVLEKLNIRFTEVVRNVEEDEQMDLDEMSAEIFAAHDLIINCTPLGMFPNVNELLPIKAEWIQAHHQYYDLVYNPLETATMVLFAQRSASVKNGLEMLHLQADRAWEIWNY